jgi:hypothetical protein
MLTSIRQVADSQNQLLGLCRDLVNLNINPQVTSEALGFTHHGEIELYLDIDYWQLSGGEDKEELSGGEDKEELMMAKRVELNCVFNRYLGEVPSLKHYRSAPSFEGYQEEQRSEMRSEAGDNHVKYGCDSRSQKYALRRPVKTLTIS